MDFDPFMYQFAWGGAGEGKGRVIFHQQGELPVCLSSRSKSSGLAHPGG